MDRNAIDVRRLLSNSVLFSGMAEEDLERIARISQIRRVDADDILFDEGDPGNQMFAIASGRVRISVISMEGKEMVLAVLGEGDFFGEISLFDGKGRTATVTAAEPCELLVIDRRDLLPTLERYPKAAIKLLAALSSRFRMTDELIADTLFLKLSSRLAKKLLSLARDYGRKEQNGVRIDFKLSQEELGNMLGVTRESINKQMSAWKEEGLIRVNEGYITIPAPDKLLSLVA